MNNNSKFLQFYESEDNCSVTTSKKIYSNHKQKFRQSKQIIIHQLNKPILMLELLMLYPKSFSKMSWILWGGDVYFNKYRSNSIKDNVLEVLRKIVITKIPTIVSYIKGDYDYINDNYKSKAKYIKAKYPSPIDIDIIKEMRFKNTDNNQTINILVGNSADPSNEHLATFKLLKRFIDEDIKIYAVLSYGGSKEYINDVTVYAKKTFGNKFTPIYDYMNFKQYLEFINDTDICLFNHKRQQGLGNQIVFFALGKKVYISDTTTPFSYYKDLGIDLCATEYIKKMNFHEFSKKINYKNNRKLILEDIDEKTIKKEWENVFK
jgi:hypothetical protein